MFESPFFVCDVIIGSSFIVLFVEGGLHDLYVIVDEKLDHRGLVISGLKTAPLAFRVQVLSRLVSVVVDFVHRDR